MAGTFQDNRARQTDCKRETGGPGVMLLGEANTVEGLHTQREGHSLAGGVAALYPENDAHRDNSKVP